MDCAFSLKAVPATPCPPSRLGRMPTHAPRLPGAPSLHSAPFVHFVRLPCTPSLRSLHLCVPLGLPNARHLGARCGVLGGAAGGRPVWRLGLPRVAAVGGRALGGGAATQQAAPCQGRVSGRSRPRLRGRKEAACNRPQALCGRYRAGGAQSRGQSCQGALRVGCAGCWQLSCCCESSDSRRGRSGREREARERGSRQVGGEEGSAEREKNGRHQPLGVRARAGCSAAAALPWRAARGRAAQVWQQLAFFLVSGAASVTLMAVPLVGAWRSGSESWWGHVCRGHNTKQGTTARSMPRLLQGTMELAQAMAYPLAAPPRRRPCRLSPQLLPAAANCLLSAARQLRPTACLLPAARPAACPPAACSPPRGPPLRPAPSWTRCGRSQ